MEIRNAQYKVRGMNKDLSYSAFDTKFSWHNHNVRLTARDGNDALSVTNERGNLLIGHNEYFRDPNPAVYHYTPTFYGWVDAFEPTTYHYESTFSNYSDTLIEE